MSSAASARFVRSLASDGGANSNEPQNDVRPRASSASCTVSRTVSSGKSVAAWKVRPSPTRARMCDACRDTSVPRSSTRPRLGT